MKTCRHVKANTTSRPTPATPAASSMQSCPCDRATGARAEPSPAAPAGTGCGTQVCPQAHWLAASCPAAQARGVGAVAAVGRDGNGGGDPTAIARSPLWLCRRCPLDALQPPEASLQAERAPEVGALALCLAKPLCALLQFHGSQIGKKSVQCAQKRIENANAVLGCRAPLLAPPLARLPQPAPCCYPNKTGGADPSFPRRARDARPCLLLGLCTAAPALQVVPRQAPARRNGLRQQHAGQAQARRRRCGRRLPRVSVALAPP